VIERAALFSQVWETQYTGDTRTLDVHISWLRQAIEDDPRTRAILKLSAAWAIGWMWKTPRRSTSG
jgi:DNA-binding response OmpR family regulator